MKTHIVALANSRMQDPCAQVKSQVSHLWVMKWEKWRKWRKWSQVTKLYDLIRIDGLSSTHILSIRAQMRAPELAIAAVNMSLNFGHVACFLRRGPMGQTSAQACGPAGNGSSCQFIFAQVVQILMSAQMGPTCMSTCPNATEGSCLSDFKFNGCLWLCIKQYSLTYCLHKLNPPESSSKHGGSKTCPQSAPLPAGVAGKVVIILVPIHPTLAGVEIQPHHLHAHGHLK